MRRQVIVTDWKSGGVRHAYVDEGPGRAISRPASALEGTTRPGGRLGEAGGRVKRVNAALGQQQGRSWGRVAGSWGR